ncbi:MAG: MBOAT family protein [Clostridia bacterium]|nr:MBOAT family protein [Clostridia bacterium]
MVFSSSVFLFGFLPVALIFYYLVFKNSRTCQNVFLFIISIFFYAWGEPVFVLVMLLSILVNWFCALIMAKHGADLKRKKAWLIVGIVFDILVLFVFKYLNFFAENIGYLFSADLKLRKIALPIGISFFTFQAMSYIIDVYRGKKDFQKNPLYVGLYIALFPQLIAGPIVRYETVADQIQNREETWELFSNGTERFIVGLGKKAILANSLAVIADAAFSPNVPVFSMAWLGALAYTLQIFFDFSAYSDMAIGLGKMFGFKFEENFNRPYLSKSISDFWRRWHISMGTWFRDYVYFPLGGSREGKGRTIFNLFVVWLLTGLWHGANWTFIVWGLFYFVFISIEKLTKAESKIKFAPLGHIYTLFLVIIGWVLFRSDSIKYALSYIKSMFGFSGDFGLAKLYIKENAVILASSVIACLPIADFVKRFKKREAFYLTAKFICLLLILVISVSYIVKGTYNPFIYFNF